MANETISKLIAWTLFILAVAWKEKLNERKEIVRIGYKVIDLPSGCSNCWGDLHQGCSDECHLSSQKHHEKIELLVTEVSNLIEKVRQEAIREVIEAIESTEIKATCPPGDVDLIKEVEILNEVIKKNIMPEIISQLKQRWLGKE